MVSNKLMLNDAKSELLVIAPKQHVANIQAWNPLVKIGDAEIRLRDQLRNLGALMDQTMGMVPQVNNVCRSMYHHLRQISKVRKHLTLDACKTAINSLLVSRLDFNNALLHGVPRTQLHRLQVAQNSAARVITRTRGRDHIGPVLKAFHWLPVSQRIVYKILLLTFKAVYNNNAPDYLQQMVKPYAPQRNLRSTNKGLLRVPKISKKAGERSFQAAAPRLWNTLNPDLRKPCSLQTFKKNLKTALFEAAHRDLTSA